MLATNVFGGPDPWRHFALNKTVLFDCLNTYFGELIQDAQKPFWESSAKTIQEEWSFETKPKWQWMFNRPIPRMLVAFLRPNNGRNRIIGGELSVEATKVVCALRAYGLANGHPPEQLADLTPEFLPALPVDPFDGKPLRYRREGPEWVLWSVGSDMKDDNAQWHEFKYKTSTDHRTGGDIYFKSTEPQDDLAFYLGDPKTKH